MRTALAFWRRGPATATSSTLVLHRPAEINWLHIALKIALSFMLLGNLMAPFAAGLRTSEQVLSSARPFRASRRPRSRAPSSISSTGAATSSLRSSQWPALASQAGTSRADAATWAGESPA